MGHGPCLSIARSIHSWTKRTVSINGKSFTGSTHIIDPSSQITSRMSLNAACSLPEVLPPPINGGLFPSVHPPPSWYRKRELLGPLSNFPSKELPIPGAHPRDLNEGLDMPRHEYKVREYVFGRRRDAMTGQWTPWFTGQVVAVQTFGGCVGSYASVYLVRYTCPETGKKLEAQLAPFLYEIWPLHVPLPNPTVEDGWQNWNEFSYVYALIRHKAEAKCSGERWVWVFSRILDWRKEKDEDFEVEVLDGPEKGKRQVARVLPFTIGTFEACKRFGHPILQSDGSIHTQPLL
ncbi:hypothetical protein K435DRAFT_161034 [Dendrothele bispora CBS 962.96]|uniref:Uncharacterized protein n=1 Tax=Dendrothele bispora (strain CBS 962.96) TaxID=1314807 RepID=A0A4S8MQ92_DENBC|nr:hypothetical protein K435DRAFT_161034 [Dendrothele bispora CBS 962.96]